MMRRYSVALLSAFAVAAGAASASAEASTPKWGSASFLSFRKCPAQANEPCFFPPTYDRVQNGGWYQTVDTQTDKGNGSAAAAIVGFDSKALPVIRAKSAAAFDERVNMNVLALQSFRYEGDDSIDLAFKGSLHYVNSYDNGVGGEDQGEGILGFHYAVWAPSRVAGRDPYDLVLDNYVFDGCGTSGVLARGFVGSDGLSGEQDLPFSLNQGCSGGGITLDQGQEVYLMVMLQSPSNRGGFVDAMNTLRIEFDEDRTVFTATGEKVGLATLNATLVNSVPEPESWAMMIAGFGLAGAAIRRAKPAVRAIA